MESTCRLYISLPKEHEDTFGEKFGEWDYGIVVTDLNPCLTDVDLRAYFHRFGTITECVINKDESSGCPKGVGFVRYSSSDQAEAPLTNDSHYLGGFQVKIRKVCTPKMNQT
ncbi:uncharacterized protein [Paramisgurnus dabryanus]|uniref:uncharacterized protein n=1 Tax=Paramisgurnus dabryanus TaxID=90735 RepID=UPI003CCF882C